MHTEPDPSHKASNPEIRYEKTDAAVRPLYQFLFWISVITLITAALSLMVLRGLESWRERASTRATMAEPQENRLPPGPRIQIREPKDLAAFRAEEHEILTTYGIADPEKKTFRIPIEEAMRLTVERGLPSVAAVDVPAAAAAPAKPAPEAHAKPAKPEPKAAHPKAAHQ